MTKTVVTKPSEQTPLTAESPNAVRPERGGQRDEMSRLSRRRPQSTRVNQIAEFQTSWADQFKSRHVDVMSRISG